MLKLKIGKNYLITDYTTCNQYFHKVIPYMMGCFKGQNLLALYDTSENYDNYNFPAEEITKIIKEHGTNTLYLLTLLDYKTIKKYNKAKRTGYITLCSVPIGEKIKQLHRLYPELQIKVLNINSQEQSKEYKMGKTLFEYIKKDNKNIANYLKVLDNYKYCAQRINAIPKELEVINNDIIRLEKTKTICDRTVTLKDLEYLNLIKNAEIKNNTLVLNIYPIAIRPSEPLGKVYSIDTLNRNPYLFKAASYIYRGYEFKMPETIIKIDKSFRPEFIETVDHTFDRMFYRHNWSTIGYPHFGQGHLCGGEFNDTMAHAKEYGLDYYFISLKQYLSTANMRDCAGVKIWWYPIYDKDNNIVYCAGFDILIEEEIRLKNPSLYNELRNMNWNEKIKKLSDFDFGSSAVQKYNSNNFSYSYQGPDSFLEKCKKENLDLYNEIMKGGII